MLRAIPGYDVKTAAFVTGKSNKEYVKKGRYDPIALPENVKFGPWTKYI